jgi:hypothetical protein
VLNYDLNALVGYGYNGVTAHLVLPEGVKVRLAHNETAMKCGPPQPFPHLRRVAAICGCSGTASFPITRLSAATSME